MALSTLRVRHLKVIYSFLLDYPEKFPKLMERIRQAVAGKTNNQLAEVEITADTLEKIYAFVSSRPEGEMSTINAEMSQTLIYFYTGQDPQILSLAQEIATKEQQLSTLMQQRVTETIQQGGEVADILMRIAQIRQRNATFVPNAIARANDYLDNGLD